MAIYLVHKPYTVNCGICGGRGGHEINDRRTTDDWADCLHCKRYVQCHLCDQDIDCRDRTPDRLLIDGAPEPVCNRCWSLEPAEPN